MRRETYNRLIERARSDLSFTQTRIESPDIAIEEEKEAHK